MRQLDSENSSLVMHLAVVLSRNDFTESPLPPDVTEIRLCRGAHGLAPSAAAGMVTEPMRPEFSSTTRMRSEPMPVFN